MSENTAAPRVSVIIPIYNVEEYLRECLDSLVGQTLRDIEIICVNGGSTDGSTQILREYAARYPNIVLVEKEKHGYGSSVNRGLSIARGEYVGIVEPDDFISKHMYERLYARAKSQDGVDIVKSNYWEYFDAKGLPVRKKPRVLKNAPKGAFCISDRPEILSMHPSVWSSVYRREFLIENDIKVVEALGAAWVDNPFFYMTMCLAKRILWDRGLYYYYRQTNPNASSIIKDCTIPIKRMSEVFDFVEQRNITDRKILKYVYLRFFNYLRKVEASPYYAEETVRPLLDTILPRINEETLYACLDRKEWELFWRVNRTHNRAVARRISLLNGSYAREIQKIKRSGAYRVGRRLIFPLRAARRAFSAVKARGIRTALFQLLERFGYYDIYKGFGDKTLRVLFIASDNNPTSGAFLSMTTLCALLNRRGGVATGVVLPYAGKGVSLLNEKKIRSVTIRSYDWVVPVDKKRDIKFRLAMRKKAMHNRKAARKIARLIRRERYDLIHINTTYPYIGALAARKGKVPYVWHLREFLEEDQSKTLWNRKRGNRLIARADRVIAISKSIYEKYLPVVGEEKLRMIYNGIDAERFYKPEKTIFNEKTVRFIYVGGFETYKGQAEFARACALLPEKGVTNFEIWFIGTGKSEVREEVRKIFEEKGLGDRVKYLGYIKNVNDYYEQADIAFTCAKSEAFGRTTVEAMLSGNLLIGADAAGTRELVKTGETGLLYPLGDHEKLAETIRYACAHREEMRLLAAAGRQYMFENMTAQINADNVYGVYQEIVKK